MNWINGVQRNRNKESNERNLILIIDWVIPYANDERKIKINWDSAAASNWTENQLSEVNSFTEWNWWEWLVAQLAG